MKKNYSTTIHLPVVSVGNEAIVAVPHDFVIDWSDFHIAALWVKIGWIQKKLLLWQDILEISNGWYIQSEDAFSDAEELIRLQPILEKAFRLRGAICKTVSGMIIGKVSDFTFDAETGQIFKLMIVNHSIQALIRELMLPVSAVQKVEDKMIIVEDLEKPLTLKETAEAAVPAPSYV